jgi:uncharacterized protein
LLAAKADVSATLQGNGDDSGDTALMAASENDHPKVVQALLDARADVNAKNNDGQTAFDLATRGGHEDVAEFLRQYGGHE